MNKKELREFIKKEALTFIEAEKPMEEAGYDQYGESSQEMTIPEFKEMVKALIKEAVEEEMMQELDRLRLEADDPESLAGAYQANLDPKTGKTPPNIPGVKPTKTGDNIMVPGTKMNVNQAMMQASKEQNIQKKAQLMAQVNSVMAQSTVKGLKKN